MDGDIARVVGELAASGRRAGHRHRERRLRRGRQRRESRPADYRRQFETNVFGVVRTLHEIPAGPAQHRSGRFVIMGSVAGHLSSAGSSPYTMSKFAVRALAEALHGELRSAGVGCTLISPGFVDSDIRRVDNRGGLHAHAKDPIPAWLRMKTDDAARIMARGILRGKKEVMVTTHAKVIVFMARHMPRLTRWICCARPWVAARAEAEA